MLETCPDCTHPKEQHTFLGCLNVSTGLCECERQFPQAQKTPERAEAEKTEAMAKAERGTDPDWAGAAIDAIRTLRDQGDFTADDVWVLLEERQVPAPREPRALGPILKAMSTGGAATIRSKGFTESRRRHGAPIRVYEARQP